MTGVRAVWELAAAMDKADPFGSVVYSTGIEIDLNAPEDELFGLIGKLLRRESSLFNRGITCDLKDGGQDCLHCPAATLDPDDQRSVLCRLGKDQRTVEGRYYETVAARNAAIEELVAVADEATEIGHMPEELAELLTEVRL